MAQIVKVCCVKHVYPDKTQVSICGLDFVVNAGERVVILGPNGTGKTTLLSHILGILAPLEGEVEVFGVQPSNAFDTIRRRIGVVFQNVDEQIIGPTVYDDIAFSMRCYKMGEDEIQARVQKIAAALGIEALLSKVPHYLSGGEKKKVALAGAISLNPELLVMDEPFDGLDSFSKSELIQLVNRLNKEMMITTIITTHDTNIVAQIADKVYVLCDGKIMARGTPKQIFMQDELLKTAKLEAPILTRLFTSLKKKGIIEDVPVSIDEARDILLRLADKHSK